MSSQYLQLNALSTEAVLKLPTIDSRFPWSGALVGDTGIEPVTSSVSRNDHRARASVDGYQQPDEAMPSIGHGL
ncbi:hypothetical protein [Actinoplanes sp. NPDC026619]|uniref:hypothetical protein n=1 Tax=Actinoplanes sp. NPDC026619 TaxID=3155798 RepID=UPI0033CB8075